jgi:hypothetical protein
MKGLKKIVMVLMVLSMVVVFAGQASAGYKWRTCTVVDAGWDDDTGRMEITLTTAGKPKPETFTAPVGQENRYLSIVMCAVTAGMQVDCFLDWDQKSGDEITKIKLLANSP